MNQGLLPHLVTTGLAVFSMFFGAGNLIFVVSLGKQYQGQTFLALAGFILTAVCLPVLGIVGISLFDGNTNRFFARAGKRTGAVLYAVTVAVIGPLIAMPRIVTLSHTMLTPYIPAVSLPVFTILFLLVTCACCITKKGILDLLGNWISPVLLLGLIILFITCFRHTGTIQPYAFPATEILAQTAAYGYNTLDFLASLYLGSVVINILGKNAPQGASHTWVNRVGLWGSCLGLGLLGLVYAGLAWLGAKTTNSTDALNEGEILGYISRQLLGHWGGLVFATVVVTACLSTIIALAALSADYLKHEVFRNHIRYGTSLGIALALTGILSNLGLSAILQLSWPILAVIYPAILALVLVNILYKTIGFQPVKSIVLTVLAMSVYVQWDQLAGLIQAVKTLAVGRS